MVHAGFKDAVENLEDLGKVGLEVEAGTYLLLASASFAKRGAVSGPVVVNLKFGELPGRAIFEFPDDVEVRQAVSVMSDASFSAATRVALDAHVSGGGDTNIRVSDITIVAIPVDGFTVGQLTDGT